MFALVFVVRFLHSEPVQENLPPGLAGLLSFVSFAASSQLLFMASEHWRVLRTFTELQKIYPKQPWMWKPLWSKRYGEPVREKLDWFPVNISLVIAVVLWIALFFAATIVNSVLLLYGIAVLFVYVVAACAGAMQSDINCSTVSSRTICYLTALPTNLGDALICEFSTRIKTGLHECVFRLECAELKLVNSSKGAQVNRTLIWSATADNIEIQATNNECTILRVKFTVPDDLPSYTAFFATGISWIVVFETSFLSSAARFRVPVFDAENIAA